MTHESLLARLREAKGSDRELDREIGLAFGGWVASAGTATSYGVLSVDGDTFPDHPGSMYPALTESVDAILALIDRALPNLVIKATKIGDGSGYWQVQEAWAGDIEVVSDYHPMDPMPGALAFCIAFVSALSAIAASEGEK